MAEFKFEIVEALGKLSTNNRAWSKELNLIRWNDREAKYDIRDWSEDHNKMGKGLTLSKEELIELKNILNNMKL